MFCLYDRKMVGSDISLENHFFGTFTIWDQASGLNSRFLRTDTCIYTIKS